MELNGPTVVGGSAIRLSVLGLELCVEERAEESYQVPLVAFTNSICVSIVANVSPLQCANQTYLTSCSAPLPKPNSFQQPGWNIARRNQDPV